MTLKVYTWTNAGRMCTWAIVDFFRPTINRKKGKHFKGEADHRKKPAMRTGDHVLAMVNDLHVIFGKGQGALAVPNDAEGHAPMWKKKSIFWDLPY